MFNVLNADPTGVNESTANAELGALYRWKHPTYGWWILRYVKFLDAVTYAAGQVVQYVATGRTSVTNDVSGGSTPICAAGVVVYGAHTQNYHGYVLVNGYYPTIKTNGDDDISAKDQLVIGAADGVVDSATTFTAGHLGYAVAADVDADNTVAGIVNTL